MPAKTPVITIEKFERNQIGPSGHVLLKSPHRYYFHLVAANGRIVGQSEPYNTARARNKTTALLAKAKLVMV